ncbi:MAG TPA: hypothetical protein VND96_07915 [Candidatus Micrarchaeaceae archaeon]|nr:hypothetical protein [Candidatus Micrarchaeaceae archaeon]
MNDAANSPAVPDDDSIGADDHVYRRVKDGGNINVVRDKDGNRKASSAAFEDDEDGISVFLESALTMAELEPAAVITGFDGYLLARIQVGLIREIGIGVVRDPDPPDAKPMPCNIAHCLLKLPSVSKGAKHRLAQNLAGMAELHG